MSAINNPSRSTLSGIAVLHHQIGSPITVNGETFIQTEKDQEGIALYGPYELYQPGIYSVTFCVMPDSDYAGNTICGFADVASSYGTNVLERTNLFIDRLLQNDGRVVLHFELPEARELEFRVYSIGNSRLRVSTGMVASPIPAKGYCPVLTPDLGVSDEFFRNNFQHFRQIYENGGELQITTQGTIARFAEVSFYVRSPDDFQLITEIFIINEYNCDLEANVLAIDVGMNVGLTSLYMARNPRVIEVHGFEPFRNPFTRSLENFSLNPKLSRKITPYNTGLSSINQELSVLSNEDSTIGTSLRGRQTGDTEIITVRNATEIFKELISRAKSKNLEVIVKIDCEGSEFAIIESLAAAGLLKYIRVLMIEWHKWWSSEKSQRDIVGPLIEDNFVIFDRTMPSNPHAGMLYAVHSDQRSVAEPERRHWWQQWKVAG